MRDGLAAGGVVERGLVEEEQFEGGASRGVGAVDRDVGQEGLLEQLGQGGEVVLVVLQMPCPVLRHALEGLIHQRMLVGEIYPRQAIQPPCDMVCCVCRSGAVPQ